MTNRSEDTMYVGEVTRQMQQKAFLQPLECQLGDFK